MFAAALLIPAAPVIVALGALVRLTSPGPAVFAQPRVGRSGKTFRLYKLRSMVRDAESRTGPVWASENDSRVTPVGRWLRHLHLDELPQLWNVVRGDMGIIGPRPERPEFVAPLSKKLNCYDHRHAIRPGITGMAQIYLPPDSSVDSVRKKLAFDLEYICSASPVLDLQIFVCTAVRLVGLRGGLGPLLTGLNWRVHKFRERARRRQEMALHQELQRKEAARRARLRARRAQSRLQAVAPLSEDSMIRLLETPTTQQLAVQRVRKPR